jgi:uncharacterized protein (TIGR03066 family)
MRLILTTVAVAILALGITGTASAKASIVGKWKVVGMEKKGKRTPPPSDRQMAIEFTKDGKFITTLTQGDKSKAREGTWTVAGKTLTTVLNGRPEKMTYELKGNTLKLTQAERPDMHLYCERASR